MGWENNPPFTIEDATNRSMDVYEVLISNWGGVGLDERQWPPGGQPGMNTSLAGIAIGPRSTVDRCWLSYNLEKPRSPPFVPGVTNRLRRISVDSPLIFSQGSNPNARNQPGDKNDPVATQTLSGALYVFAEQNIPGIVLPPRIEFSYPDVADSTVIPATYTDIHGVAQMMGESLAGNMSPLLHLYLYLKAPIAYAPVKRFPLQVQKTNITTPEAGEQLIAQIPTFGRKYIRIMMMANVPAAFRVGALRTFQQLNGMQEQPVDQALAIPANTPTILGTCAISDFADYTNLYATVAAPGKVLFQLTAYD